MMGTQDRGEDIRLSVRKTILVCDDETDLLLMFRIHLESQYNVITVDSGKSCVDTILDYKNKNKEIDLLLLDYKLGDISGDVVARKIKEIEDMKILLITAFELDNQIISELMQNRLIVDVVKKPIQLEKLSQKIKETIVN
jgi:response regulator RpfG family c-di-GMP phosphodiesterase